MNILIKDYETRQSSLLYVFALCFVFDRERNTVFLTITKVLLLLLLDVNQISFSNHL